MPSEREPLITARRMAPLVLSGRLDVVAEVVVGEGEEWMCAE